VISYVGDDRQPAGMAAGGGQSGAGPPPFSTKVLRKAKVDEDFATSRVPS